MKRAILFIIVIVLFSFPYQLLGLYTEITVTIINMLMDINRDLASDGYETIITDTFRYAELKYDEQGAPYYDYFGFQIKAKVSAINIISKEKVEIKEVVLQYFNRYSLNWMDVCLSGNKGPARLSYDLVNDEWVASFTGDDSLGKLIPSLKGNDETIWLRVLATAKDDINTKNALDRGIKLIADANPPKIISLYGGTKDSIEKKQLVIEKAGDTVDLWLKSADFIGIKRVKFHYMLLDNSPSILPRSNDWLDIGDGVIVEKSGDEELWKCEWKTPKYMLNTDMYIIAATVSDKADNLISTKKFNTDKRIIITSKTLFDVSGLKNFIDTRLYQRQQYPSYLLDTSSFSSAVNTIWQDFTDWFRRKDLTDNYENLYYMGIEYDNMRFNALIKARDFLNNGDTANARRLLEKADAYEKMSYYSFQGANYVFEANLEEAKFLSQKTKDFCQASVKFGLKFVNPTAAEVADWIYDIIDLSIEYYIGDKEQAVKDFILKRSIDIAFNEVILNELDGKTLSDWTGNRMGKYLFPILSKITKNEKWQWALSKVIKEGVSSISEETLTRMIKFTVSEADKFMNSIVTKLKSPAEIRVYDSQDRVTGLIDGKVKNEIPGSMYNNEIVTIFLPTDVYRYEVVGKDKGTYGLEITLTKDANPIMFNATEIATSVNAVHNYSIDWDALSFGEKGVIVNKDSDGDGKFEETVIIGAIFTEHNCDVNSDGIVNILDLVIVGKNIGKSKPDNAKADVNKDGVVDMADLDIVRQHFGEIYK